MSENVSGKPANSKSQFSDEIEFDGVTIDDGGTMRMTRQLLTDQFVVHRERLWRAVQIRMDPRLYGRVDPDDILQEAFLDAMKRVRHFAEELTYSPFVWIRLIVGQTLINVHRRHILTQKRDASRERSQFSSSGHSRNATTRYLAIQLAASQTSPSEALMRSESVASISNALDGLSESDREILLLRHFEDFTNKEAAQFLGVAQKTASIRYVRAIKRLKVRTGASQSG